MKNLYDKNFWDVHPEYLLITEFKDYYTKDTSKDKQASSKILWAVYFAYNPESRFYNIPDKLDILSRDFIKDSKFKFVNIKNIIDIYKNSVLTDAERALVTWGEIITMRDESIKLLYKEAIQAKNTDELVKLDKMLSNTPKLFEDFKKIKKDYEEEKITKKGKHINSLTESGEI